MGTCFSKKKKTPSPFTNGHLQEKSPAPKSGTLLQANPRKSPPSPPPILEEETVKEVLSFSETPKPSFPIIESKPSFPNTQEEEEEEVVEKIEEKIPAFISGDEASEFSETVSTTTTNAEKKGDGEEVEMRPKENSSPAKFRRKRSFSGDFPARIERSAKSPAGSFHPSPGRRTPVREVGRTNRSRTPTGSSGFRRDTGDCSGRRSRSPATRKELGRTSSGRKTGRSPCRNPVETTEDGGRKVEEREEGTAAPSASKESLENPLVSLECFIFL